MFAPLLLNVNPFVAYPCNLPPEPTPPMHYNSYKRFDKFLSQIIENATPIPPKYLNKLKKKVESNFIV